MNNKKSKTGEDKYQISMCSIVAKNIYKFFTVYF